MLAFGLTRECASIWKPSAQEPRFFPFVNTRMISFDGLADYCRELLPCYRNHTGTPRLRFAFCLCLPTQRP